MRKALAITTTALAGTAAAVTLPLSSLVGTVFIF